MGLDAQELSLMTIMKGSVPEFFAAAVDKIMANVADPNTLPTEERKLVMEFTFKPFPDRSGVNITLKPITPKLAGLDTREVTCTAYLAKVDGKFKGFTRDMRQELLFSEEKPVDGKTASSGQH
jgi:hypothetical protein